MRSLNTLAVALFVCLAAGIARSAPPNVVVIIGDDMTWTDCTPYGSPNAITPNLERLAGEGMKFDLMFQAPPMCSPTRQSLYTGMYPVRNGAHPNHSQVYEGTKSAAHHFQSLGYRTSLVGKKHYGPAESFPFEELPGPEHDDGRGHEFSFDDVREFVTRDGDEPFFMVVCSNQAHTPWNRGDPSHFSADDFQLDPWLADTPKTRELLTRYYGEVEYLDGQVGQTLDILDEAGLAENTIVVFLSEQGQQMPGGKWTLWDPGIRAAAFVRWPGHVEAGSETSALCEYVDVIPTLFEAAGGDPTAVDTGTPDANGDRGFDGKSFLKVLTGEADEHKEVVYGIQTTRGIHSGSDCYPIRSARSKDFKLIWNLNPEEKFQNVVTNGAQGGLLKNWENQGGERGAMLAERYVTRPEWELYDLRSDPWEMDNLLADASPDALTGDAATAFESLHQSLDAWMAQQGDKGIETEMDARNRQRAGQEE